MIVINCLIIGHPVSPHHHAIGEGMRSVAFGCDTQARGSCHCPSINGPVYARLT